ncbi:hypothetical protein [Acaryochloris sp. IP29b_bin.148]|uniref:hypothetical protein n=1 Tax=Acaryochloris sp. IP29b_bin.148 TaxID=2969218 RepID=UPI002605FD4A|nr:hypothetical protein [Acaryochloris sp. IP29b_bin.148]
MPYRESLSTSHPGYLILLIDQSASMADPLPGGGVKADECAKAVNRVLREIGLACTVGEDVKNRCDVSVISYGAEGNAIKNALPGLLGSKPIVTMQELVNNVKDIVTVKRKVSDGAGGLVEIDDDFPIWIEPSAFGSTPMGMAFLSASKLVETWTKSHKLSFPPIIINITDGEPNDITAAKNAAHKLMNSRTNDGQTLVLNIHISASQLNRVELPSKVEELPDKYSHFLFDISSALPSVMVERAHVLGFNPKPMARGMVYNADAEAMIRLLDIGTRANLR